MAAAMATELKRVVVEIAIERVRDVSDAGGAA